MGGPAARRHSPHVAGHTSLPRRAGDQGSVRCRSSWTCAGSEGWFLFPVEGCERTEVQMTTKSRVGAILIAFAVAAAAQVKTEVPAAVPGAKPAVVEHIKIHGAALEGNLEND